MVYMEDSRRAAEIARSQGMPVGLHLNVSETLTAPDVPPAVRERHARLVRIFWRMQLMRWVYVPGIQRLVSACVEDQYQAFLSTYGHEPTHWDGHHFLHLCPNVLVTPRFRAVDKVRKSLTFRPGERSALNRAIRTMQNTFIERGHQTADHVWLLTAATAHHDGVRPGARVEAIVHPELPQQRAILESDKWASVLSDFKLGSYADL
jgi:predicted glycoside hydrolase/deacetylase ChbG (UPF0249 family)